MDVWCEPDVMTNVTLLPPRFKQLTGRHSNIRSKLLALIHTRSNNRLLQLWNLRFLAQETQCTGTWHENGIRKKKISKVDSEETREKDVESTSHDCRNSRTDSKLVTDTYNFHRFHSHTS